MESIENIREAAKDKLVGFTEREIECFMEGARYIAGHLPQRRSDEWYRQQAEKREQAQLHVYERMKFPHHEDGIIGAAIDNFLDDAVADPDTRKKVLNVIEATDNKILAEILCAIKTGIEGFNGCHTTQLNFQREPENGNRWTFSWDDPLIVE